MGRGHTGWVLGALAFASSGALGCGASTSSSNGGAGLGGGAGRAGGGAAGQGDAGRASGGAAAGGSGGSNASVGGMSGSGGSAGALAGAGGAAGASGGTAAGSGGAATAGVSGSSGAAGEGAGDSGGEGSGTGGRPPSIDCSGTFGEPHVVLAPGANRLFSPTVSADETELLYAMGDATTLQYFRSTRASKLDEFGEGVPVPELDAACEEGQNRTIDLTPDGLRAYLVCYDLEDATTFELHVAERPALDAPFVLDPKTYGQVGPSAGIAPGELTLYSSGHVPGQEPALVFERSSIGASFDTGKEIPGLEGTLLLTPDVSPDGLSLYGSLMGNVVVATRATANDDFTLGAPVVPSDFAQWVSATISEDCRSLYAVRQTPQLTVEMFTR